MESMKPRHILCASALAFGLAGGGSNAAADELSVATFVPPQHHIHRNFFAWFGQELDSRSNGTLTIKEYPGGQLGAGPVQQYKRVVEGVADIVFGLQTYTPTVFPKTLLIVPPGKSRTPEDSTRRLLSVYDEYLADEYEEVALIGIFTTAGDGWAARKDLSSMDDLVGAKIVPFAAMTSPILEAMGAVPVQMTVTEMYTGLGTGTIDGTTIAPGQMGAPWNFSEVSSHYIENIPVTFAVFFIAMNKERYLGLSDEHRAIIDELSGETASLMGAASFQSERQRGLDFLATDPPEMANVARVRISDEVRAEMDAAVAAGLKVIFADYAERGIGNAEEIYNAINR